MVAAIPGDDPVEQWPLTRLLVTASRIVEHDMSAHLRPRDLTHAGFGVLALLQRGPRSQREIATATRVGEQTISRTVDRLVRLGMVTRETDSGDRRRHVITVTPQGRRTFRQATSRDPVEEALEHLPDREALREALTALIHQWDGAGFVSLDEPGPIARARDGD
jgi:DNA-binding MarR family transcriptional regulator